MDVIHTENLTKRYGTQFGLRALNLSVSEGQVFGFLGPNGSGKTTMIRLLLGLLRPTEGRATIRGMDCWRRSRDVKGEVGYLPGDLRLYPWMNARNGLRIVGQIRRRDLRAPGMELVDRFELDPDVRVRNMSRGMRQKLGLILALAHRPKVVILDEPTSSLDPPMQQALYAHIRERAAQGATVFFSSHTLSEVDDLCDRVAILRAGELVENDSLANMRARAARLVTLDWQEGAAERVGDLPDVIRVLERRGNRWTCELTGGATDFIQWAATQALDDLTIGPPDLEHLFKQYYHDEDADS
ncbi:MAG: ABC transporter ATP-binding protein [Candidatus Hydrogenedentes bacterium]|nr:ABC transporter ATP-binding protein [Candidatus Hydrogenedentota bacterium]